MWCECASIFHRQPLSKLLYRCWNSRASQFVFSGRKVLQLILRNNKFHLPENCCFCSGCRCLFLKNFCRFQMSSLHCSSPHSVWCFLKTLPDFMKFKFEIIHCVYCQKREKNVNKMQHIFKNFHVSMMLVV